MDPYDMPTEFDIPSEYHEKIDGDSPVDGLLEFLNDHAYSHLHEYEGLLQFDGYEDDNGDPRVIPLKNKIEDGVLHLTANFEYSVVEQQNSCADSLASVKHSVRLIYSHQLGEHSVEVEFDPTWVEEPDLREYGY